MNTKCEAYQSKMQKTIEVLKHDFKTIRVGRANPSVLDKISVEYFGSAMPINQLANINSPEPRMLTIQPWDASALKAIEKAILTSDLGLNPQNDGKMIRLTFPQLTEERRRELTRDVKKMGEDAKIAVRNIRRDAVDLFKKQEKVSEITEDDLKVLEKEIQDLTDRYCRDVELETAAKEKEIIEI